MRSVRERGTKKFIRCFWRIRLGVFYDKKIIRGAVKKQIL